MKIFGSIFLIFIISCSPEVDKCSEFTIEELVNDICENQMPYNECVKEVEEYLLVSCN